MVSLYHKSRGRVLGDNFRIIPSVDKIRWIDQLSYCNLRCVQVEASNVSDGHNFQGFPIMVRGVDIIAQGKRLPRFNGDVEGNFFARSRGFRRTDRRTGRRQDGGVVGGGCGRILRRVHARRSRRSHRRAVGSWRYRWLNRRRITCRRL